MSAKNVNAEQIVLYKNPIEKSSLMLKYGSTQHHFISIKEEVLYTFCCVCNLENRVKLDYLLCNSQGEGCSMCIFTF